MAGSVSGQGGTIYRRYAQRRRGKWRKFLAITSFLLFICIVLHNLYNILRSLDIIVTQGDAKFYPEYAPDTQVRNIAELAYKNEWVGFSNFPAVPCRRAILKPAVNNDWFQTLSVAKISDKEFATGTESCQEFQNKYGYLRYPEATQEEQDFPMAFIILFHKDFHQIHILLRAIYKPHNVYCLTPDANSDPDLLAAAKYVASCLPNVFVASRLEHIVYTGFSRLMADLNCMKDLLKHPVNWKYVINMPGQQFPLRTNLEMVRIIRKYNGANDIQGMTGWRSLPKRYRTQFIEVIDPDTGKRELSPTNKTHTRPPFGLRVVKGSAYNTMSRQFIEYVLTAPKVKVLLDWLKLVLSPDEYFWAILNHNSVFDAPGRYRGIPSSKPHMTTFSIWSKDTGCSKIYIREVCILTPADFPLLRTRHELFANKFYIDYYPAALHCLDQMIFNKTLSGQVELDNNKFYKHIKFALPSTGSSFTKEDDDY